MIEDAKQQWDARVADILRRTKKRGLTLMCLGYLVYGLGSLFILWFIKDKAMGTVLVMFFFQLCVIYMGTAEIFPNISGAFKTSLEATRDSVPLFARLAKTIESLETSPEKHPLVKTIGDKLEKSLDARVNPLIERWARIGERVEETLLPRIERTLDTMNENVRRSAAKVSATAEGVQRLEQRVEGELDKGLVQDLREAIETIKLMAPGLPTPKGGAAPLPSASAVLSSLDRPKPVANGVAVPVSSAPGGQA